MAVSITKPASGATLTGLAVVEATYNGKNFEIAAVTIDGQQASSDSAKPISFSIDTAKVADGSHTLTVAVRYRTAGGNRRWQKASIPITTEGNDMKVDLSTSGGTANLTGTVTVTATVTPSSQALTPVSCKFSVDNGPVLSTDTSYPLTFSLNTASVTDGNHTLRAVVTAGPRTRTATGALTVSVLNSPGPPPPPPPPQNVPVNVSVPTISDTTPQEGQTISVSPGSWTNEPTSYTYQWRSCDGAGANCVSIPSAAGATYTCSVDDVGATLRCSVTAHNNVGASAAAQSAQTTAVSALVAAVPTIISVPVLSGSAVQGSTLIAGNGSWTNSPTSYTRQWKRCEPSIITSSINDGDTIVNGQVWTVTTIPDVDLVEFYADGVLVGSSTAEPHTETISLSAGARNLGLKTTTGGAETIHSDSGVVGRFAAVTVSAGPAVYNGAGDVISGATGSQYTLVAADVGKVLRCLTTAVNATGSSIPAQSEATATVTSSAPPEPPPPNAYWNELWESGVVPPNWLTERNTFGNGDVAKITYAFVADPLSQKGTTLRLKCAYDATKTQVSAGNYPDGARQLVSLYRGAGQAHSAYQTINEETWYRIDFMFPSGNVFADGEANFIVEWHTDPNTSGQGGTSPALLCAYGYPLTADGTTSPLGIFLRWNSGNPASPTKTYWPSSDGSGSINAKTPVAFQANHWYVCKVRVIWSKDPSIGRVEWWMDGVQKLARSMATLYTNPNNWNSQSFHNFGLYNYRYNVTGDSSFYFDKVAAGPTLTSIGG